MFATFQEMKHTSIALYIFSKIYLYSFISLFIYVVLSLFIGIICDTYERLKVKFALTSINFRGVARGVCSKSSRPPTPRSFTMSSFKATSLQYLSLTKQLLVIWNLPLKKCKLRPCDIFPIHSLMQKLILMYYLTLSTLTQSFGKKHVVDINSIKT